jgi:HEPN domain-containing protein
MLPLVQAKDITFSLGQKDYYFKTGEDALISLKSENSYKETINGMLTYTITQSINQGNFQYSSSNTQSKSFSVDKGESDIPLNFGTSDTPMTLSVGLRFSYTKDEAREVILDDIKIHFVSDESQKNNQQSEVSSSSQKAQAPQQQTYPFIQQGQRMQQMMDQMFGNQQQQPQTAQQRLQNNQLSQDSSALKQQMQNQLQEQQQMKQEFQKQLEKNQELLKEHQELLNKGFNLTNTNFNPLSNNTGSFELSYENQNGEQASLKGDLQDGELNNLEKDTPETRQKIMEQLQNNQQFQKYHKQLQKQGFAQQNAEFSHEQNKTNVQLNYANPNNETATIKAEIINNTVAKIELVNETKKEKKNYWRILLVLLLLGVLGYFAYKKFFKKPQSEETIVKNKVEMPFDYGEESLAMLKKAKKLFERKEYKDAYGKAGQALRLYLSYENNLKKEITNDEIIEFLRKNKRAFKDAKDCFDLCSLVEFAKYQANKKDFDKIMSYAKKIIE